MDAYKNLYQRTADGIKPGLEVVELILNNLNNPHLLFPVIHIAGTNGKGSVCSMIESVLRNSGLKTGLFTSPHLIHFKERYRINGNSIPDNRLNRLILSLGKYADEVCEENKIRRATFFEISSIIAFQYFADEDVDIAIIEVGMGGRWDATNVVDPLLSVITHIAMDHMDYLGDSLEEIAEEKAGIIKKGRPVISAPQSDEVMKVLNNKDQRIIYTEKNITAVRVGLPQKIKFSTMSQNLPPINLPLLGEFQCENASIAISALEIISDLMSISLNYKKGLESVKWPGRFMQLSKNPISIFDGAHNPDAAKELAASIRTMYPKYKCGFIIGFLNDKDVYGYIEQISSITEKIWTVSLDTHRGLSSKELSVIIDSFGQKTFPMSMHDAWKDASLWANNDENRIIIIAGSLRLSESLVLEGIFSESLLTS